MMSTMICTEDEEVKIMPNYFKHVYYNEGTAEVSVTEFRDPEYAAQLQALAGEMEESFKHSV